MANGRGNSACSPRDVTQMGALSTAMDMKPHVAAITSDAEVNERSARLGFSSTEKDSFRAGRAIGNILAARESHTVRSRWN
jgi:hypothetical protein